MRKVIVERTEAGHWPPARDDSATRTRSSLRAWAVGRRLRAWLGSRLWRQGRFRTANQLRTLAQEAGLTVKTVQGAVYYPRWGIAARALRRLEPALGRTTTIGAGFVALAASKPIGEP